MHGKAKGNSYERKTAKQIGKWIFNDETMLWRESTSGMRKVVYRGDIVPAKAHEYPWSCWPFLFEAKSGYKQFIPTLMNQNKVREWLHKLIGELTEEQFTPMLIAQFQAYEPLLITTLEFSFYCDICMIQEYGGQFYRFYVYDYNKLLKENFYEVCPKELLNHINKNKLPHAAEQVAKSTTNYRIRKQISHDGKYAGIEHLLGDILS